MPDEKRPLKVFLCYAHTDEVYVRSIYNRLINDGVDVWLDKENLLPGQNWELEIRNAVRESDVVVVCLSKRFNQAGFRQKEVRIVLDTATEQPEGEIFIIPARLEECKTLEYLKKWRWVDLFKAKGYETLMKSLKKRARDVALEPQFNLSINMALRYTQQISIQLIRLHKNKLIHGNLKPSEIRYTDENHAKVVISSTQPESPAHESTVHDSNYMSPEQLKGTTPLTPASDVFSLGLILFEMLTGQKYREQSPGTKASKFRSGVPIWVDKLLEEMLAIDPKKRIPNSEEVTKRLLEKMSTTEKDIQVSLSPDPWPRIFTYLIFALIFVGLLILYPIFLLINSPFGSTSLTSTIRPSQTVVYLASNTPISTRVSVDLPPIDVPSSITTLTLSPSLTQTSQPSPVWTQVPTNTPILYPIRVPTNAPIIYPTYTLPATYTPLPTYTPFPTYPPTFTRVPPSPTKAPSTATRIHPTSTPIPPTATQVPPTFTPVPPTATQIPPTATFTPIPPADIVIVPRNYNFNWSTSGQNIAQNNTVYCSSNPDFTRVLYWRTSDSGGWVDWNPTITAAGNYDVYVYLLDYTHNASITTQARYYLNGGTLMGGVVDQNQNKCSWYFLGKYYLSSGSYVHMTTGTSENPYRLISADGMLFRWSP